MEEKKITSEAETASALKRMVRLAKPGTVGVMQPIAKCVKALQDEFDLPTDDLTTVRIAKIINDWHREETVKIAEIINQIGNRDLTVWAVKDE